VLSPRTRSRLAVAGSALAVVAVAGAALAVTAPSVALGPPTFSGAPVVTLPAYGARGTHVVDYRDGQRVTLRLPVTNDGRSAVTVTGASLGEGPHALLEVTSVERVRLAPGETREVAVEAVLDNCEFFHMRETQSYDALELRLSAPARTVTRTVALDRPLLVHSPMIVGCPDRRLDVDPESRSVRE
jgi:hypothetical protein